MVNRIKNESKAKKSDIIGTEFTNSLAVDKRLFKAEIEVHLAYCVALFHAGILNRIESDKIKNALLTIKKRASFDDTYFDNFPSSNIQNFVEARLFQLLGDLALKIKTGKFPLEQFSTSLRLWLRKEIEKLLIVILGFQQTILNKAVSEKQSIIPGFVNNENKHPILFQHWALAYVGKFSRDREILDEVWRRTNILPLGAGKLAGTSIEIDYEEIAKSLGFEGIKSNSIDAVTDFDFVLEHANACSLIMLHLSGLSKNLFAYSGRDRAIVVFENDKEIRNNSPSFKEILLMLQAKTSRVLAAQSALQMYFINMSVPSVANFQEILSYIFDISDCVKDCIGVSADLFSRLKIDSEVAESASKAGGFYRNELIDYLIYRGVSFGTANNIVRKVESFAENNKKHLTELSLDEFREFSADFEQDVLDALNVREIVESKNQLGGTSSNRVSKALEKAIESLERDKV